MRHITKLLKALLKLLGTPVQDTPRPMPTPPPMPKRDPVTNTPIPKKPERIFRIGISPGHGGRDTGAVSATGLKEAVVARALATKIKARFDRNKAFDTEIYDYGIDQPKNYRGRVKRSDARGDDYYLPIHFNNWAPKPQVNGWLLFVDPQDAERNPYLFPLCKEILKRLQQAYPLGFRDWDDVRDGYMAGIGRKVYEETAPKADSLYSEFGFLSNELWAEKLQDDKVLEFIADKFVTGFETFLKVEEFKY